MSGDEMKGQSGTEALAFDDGVGRISEEHTSGAKAHADYIAFTPGINPRPTLKPSFSAACSART